MSVSGFLRIQKFFKTKYHCNIIVGGQHVSLFPYETLRKKEIDFGIIGEAEETIVELINALEKKKKLEDIQGIVYKKNKKVKITKLRDKIKNLDKVPFPARNLIPMKKYFSYITKYKNYAIIMTSRGCTFQCSFCEQRTGDVRFRSPKNVVDEIEECTKKFNVREIDIFDPLFTINKKRVIQICKEIQKRKIKINWSCRSRVDTIHEDMLIEMKKAGCYRIYFGIESGDENILKKLRKNTTILKIKNAIHLTKKNKILAFGYFMIGNPGESIRTIKKTIKLAKELPLDYAQFSRLSVLPGTSLYEELKTQIGYDYWQEYIKDKKNERALPRVDSELSEETINKYIKKAYKEFYFRPSVMINFLLNIKSLNEFLRYIKAGFNMLFEK